MSLVTSPPTRLVFKRGLLADHQQNARPGAQGRFKKGARTASSPYGLSQTLFCGDEAVPAP
jgi:hypothetical protein